MEQTDTQVGGGKIKTLGSYWLAVSWAHGCRKTTWQQYIHNGGCFEMPRRRAAVSRHGNWNWLTDRGFLKERGVRTNTQMVRRLPESRRPREKPNNNLRHVISPTVGEFGNLSRPKGETQHTLQKEFLSIQKSIDRSYWRFFTLTYYVTHCGNVFFSWNILYNCCLLYKWKCFITFFKATQ